MLREEVDNLAHHVPRHPGFRSRPEHGVRIQLPAQRGGRLSAAQMLFVDNQNLRQDTLDAIVVANKSHQRQHPSCLGR